MLKNNLYILFYITLSIGFVSCGASKKVVNNQPNPQGVVDNGKGDPEYNAFFEAETARLKGDKTQARTLYRDFVKVYKSNATAYFNLAKLEFQSFHFNDAEEYISKAVTLSPKNKYFLELYADVLSLNKKPEKAVKIYEDLAQLPNADIDQYQYKQFKIYADLNQYDKALRLLSDIEKRWGLSEEISLQKVDLLLKLKKEEAAIDEIKKLVEDEPRNPTYKERLGELYERLGKTEEAMSIYNQLANDAPNDAKILMRTSSYYLRSKDTVGFKRIVKSIVNNPSIERPIRMSMLQPLIELNNDSTYMQKEILPIMETLRNEDPKDLESAMMYADVLYSARKYEEAAQAYRTFLNNDQSKFGAWFNLMLCHSNLNQLDSIIAIADESFDYFPNNAFTHYFKGTAQFQKNEFKESVSSLQNAIDLEPEKELKAQIYAMLGDAYNSLADYKKSEENFDKSLKIKEDASTLNNYAYYLSLRNDRLEDALKMSGRSLELMPDTKTFLDTYGWILYKQGKLQKAKEYIEKAIEGEGDADVLEHLGDIYYKLSNIEKAKEYWQKAKRIGGGGSKNLDKKIQDGKLYE